MKSEKYRAAHGGRSPRDDHTTHSKIGIMAADDQAGYVDGGMLLCAGRDFIGDRSTTAQGPNSLRVQFPKVKDMMRFTVGQKGRARRSFPPAR